jgi:membrane-bound lytic murein transglycosylase F
VLYPAHKLVVAVRAGPAGWQIGPDGKPHGLEHDLVMQFAIESGLPLVTIPVDSASALSRKIARREASLGIGGLYRAVDPVPPRARNGEPLPVDYTRGFHPVDSVVIHGSGGFRPKRWSDLKGAVVSYIRATGLDAEVERLAREHPDVRFVPLDLPSADALIARVSESRVDYALVSSLQAALARNVHLDFDIAFSAGSRLELAWMLRKGDESLRARLDAFLERARRSGLVERLVHRYFAHAQEVPRIDAGVFQDRIRTVLPSYRRHFLDAQEATGVEWRLLAAVAYQESQWEPLATSETGVRGFMQLTEETAKHLGVADRLDPRASVLGAARYLQDLKSRLPKRIPEPDRTWLALAAFNIGLGHLEDARVLAQRQKLNPDAWQDVKQALPLLALPEHYEKSRLGYARGGMPVAFVERVRGYYDILLRHESAHAPRLRVAHHGS